MFHQNQELKVSICIMIYNHNNLLSQIIMVELSTLLFMGDQLTVERARKTAKSRVNAPSAVEALEGLHPAVCDWHAECIFLQVCVYL